MMLEVVQNGLVEIESSSGSSSESSSYDSSEEVERAPPSFQKPRYSEDVPADRDFYRHSKSGILHSSAAGKRVTLCKVAIGYQFKLQDHGENHDYQVCEAHSLLAKEQQSPPVLRRRGGSLGVCGQETTALEKCFTGQIFVSPSKRSQCIAWMESLESLFLQEF